MLTDHDLGVDKDEAERHLPDKFATDDGDEDELGELLICVMIVHSH